MSDKKAHSKLGASSAYRWTNCPGSYALSNMVPPAPSSAYAEEGTAAHALADKCLQSTPAARWYISQKTKFNDRLVTEEMADAVQKYVDYVRDIKNETGGELLVEHRFHLGHLHPEFFGTCDAVVMQDFGELHIIDFKYGEGIVVDVEENEQLQYYALGALELGDFEKVVLHICQPRVENGFKKWETTPQKLREFGKFLKIKALEAQKKDAPLKSGEWCRFCPAAAICPELHKTAVEVARTDFMEPKLPTAQALTHAQIAKVIEHRKMIEKWFEQVEEYAHQALMRGEKIEGVKLVKGRSRREWIDDAKAEMELVKKLGDRAFKTTLVSVAKAEEYLGKDTIAGMFHTLDGSLLLVPSKDKRAEVKPARDEFEAIDENEF